ncbi:MAG: M1 family metallopeptidase [Flavisolibacter sp.]
MKKFLLLFSIFLSINSFAQHPVDVLHYRFEIEVTDGSDAITGKAIIKVKFLENASLVQFDLVSPEDEKGMRVFQVKEGEQLLQFNQSNDILSINLATPAKKGEERSFEINYMGVPKDGLIISKNKFGDRTFFGDNWPNRAHNWLPCIDRPDDKAPFDFIVTAPAQYNIVSNGNKMGETLIGAGSGKIGKRKSYWREVTPLSTKIMVIGISKFAVKQFADSPPSIPVTAWVYVQDSSQGFYDYGVTPSIVKFFSNYIAPFPYKKLANVQSTTIFGGMENAGAIFYAEGSVTGDRKWEDVYAHEIVHQWFGDMASEKSFAHLWLSEGFATYLTNIYFEQKYGKDSVARRMLKDKERVIEFAKQNDHPIVDTTSDLMSLLNANSYQKGSWVLHMLRNEVGDTVFRKIIQTYYAQYKGSNADSRDFEAVAEKVSGKELTWFFDQWLYRGGIPELDIEIKKEKDEAKVKITQGKDLYQFHLAIRIETADGKKINEKILVKDKETEYKWKGTGPFTITVDDSDLLYTSKQ